MSRYSKTLWDTLTVYNPTNMNHIEQGIYDADLRAGGTINGDFVINRTNGTTASVGESVLVLGNDTSQGTTGNSKGLIRFYDNLNHKAILTPSNNMTADRFITLPDKAGTIALTSDITDKIGQFKVIFREERNTKSEHTLDMSYHTYLIVCYAGSANWQVGFAGFRTTTDGNVQTILGTELIQLSSGKVIIGFNNTWHVATIIQLS